MTEKEEKLIKVVKRLELKIKEIWDENNTLKQKLQLSNLDKEISEENCRTLEAQHQQAQAEYSKLKSKIAQLEELNELNQELENSYNSEKASLLSEIDRLQSAIQESNFNVQEFEALQIELKTTERKLRAASFDLALIRDGVAETLTGLFGATEWIIILEALNLDVSEYLNQYKKGTITASKLGDLLFTLISSYDKPLSADQIHSLLRLHDTSPMINQLIEKNKSLIDEINMQEEENLRQKHNFEQREEDAETEALKLRIDILEAKLKNAQLLGNELALLKEQQNAMLEKEELHILQIQQLKERISDQDQELHTLTKKALPAEIAKASQTNIITELHSTVAYLTRTKETTQWNGALSPLEKSDTPKIAATIGNKRVNKLRKLRFELVSPKYAAYTGADQETQLMFL